MPRRIVCCTHIADAIFLSLRCAGRDIPRHCPLPPATRPMEPEEGPEGAARDSANMRLWLHPPGQKKKQKAISSALEEASQQRQTAFVRFVRESPDAWLLRWKRLPSEAWLCRFSRGRRWNVLFLLGGLVSDKHENRSSSGWRLHQWGLALAAGCSVRKFWDVCYWLV